MKFAQVVQGTRAERRTSLPGAKTAEGEPIPLILRPLDDEEDTLVLAAAAKVSRDHGGTGSPEDPLYDRAIMVHTLLVGCLDVDSPETSRTPFFDSAEQISKLDRDTIAMLHELHATFQNEVSPLARKMSSWDLYDKALEVAASESPDPFVGIELYTRWSFTRTLALLLIGLPDARSLFGLPSVATSKPVAKPASKATSKRAKR